MYDSEAPPPTPTKAQELPACDLATCPITCPDWWHFETPIPYELTDLSLSA